MKNTLTRKPEKRKPRACEVCAKTYIPTYSKQRTCGRPCGVELRRAKGSLPAFREPEPLRSYLDAPITAERNWVREDQKRRYRIAVLSSYHANPGNWSTKRKRRRLFERDGWRCRVCRRKVSDTVSPTAANRAVAGHILARAAGGDWSDDNMATLCHPCNVADGVNKIPIQKAIF